jgi:hypothetical protein
LRTVERWEPNYSSSLVFQSRFSLFITTLDKSNSVSPDITPSFAST